MVTRYQEPGSGIAHSDVTPIFGKALEVAAGPNKLPILVKELIDFLCEKSNFPPTGVTHNQENLEEEGIGRQSGSQSEIQQLKKDFDAGKKVNLRKQDIHAVMGVFKVYFRDLPKGIIPEEINKRATSLIGTMC
jgi:hypothetical protein